MLLWLKDCFSQKLGAELPSLTSQRSNFPGRLITRRRTKGRATKHPRKRIIRETSSPHLRASKYYEKNLSRSQPTPCQGKGICSPSFPWPLATQLGHLDSKHSRADAFLHAHVQCLTPCQAGHHLHKDRKAQKTNTT